MLPIDYIVTLEIEKLQNYHDQCSIDLVLPLESIRSMDFEIFVPLIQKSTWLVENQGFFLDISLEF